MPSNAGPSVGVLAFEDMSPDQDQEYFCDGIAEEILNRLNSIAPPHVASRTSSFRFKRRDADIGAIGRELRVNTVLEGSVRKSGHRVRIATQLVNASDGFQLSSRSFDEVDEDIFRIQNEIASQVADALKVTLAGTAARGATRALAPNLAEAHVSRGLAHAVRRLDAEAVAEFEKAIELDPALFSAWYFYGRVRFQQGDLDGARRLFEEAERLRPDDFQAPILLRQVYESLGRR